MTALPALEAPERAGALPASRPNATNPTTAIARSSPTSTTVGVSSSAKMPFNGFSRPGNRQGLGRGRIGEVGGTSDAASL
jgi:hypothetical protein